MNHYIIFAVRILLGIFFAVLLSRFFFPDAGILSVAGMGVFLVGLAYIFEYFRNRKAS
jgi:hypothetical protein